jgi:hypothetical protein
LFFAFVDLEKAFDRVPRQVVQWALRKLGVEEWLVISVMTMYEKARTMVRSKSVNSEQFEVNVGVHQGSVLSPLLFIVVMEVLARHVKEGLPWELLYADDLVLIAESIEILQEKVTKWKDCLEEKGLKVNVNKTKVMHSARGCGEIVKTGKWPCAVCGKGVMSNCIKCTSCSDWVHKKCSGVKGSLTREMETFECKVCLKARTDVPTDDQDIIIGNGVKLDCVPKFCYLGDVLNGNGGAESASVSRVRTAWKKFRELSGILLNKEVSLKLKGRIYATCVRSAMLYASETWPMTAPQEQRFERTEMRMVRWMSGVSLIERKTSVELRDMMGIEAVSSVVRRNRLRWLGHVLRKDEDDWVRKTMDLDVQGTRRIGRPRTSWDDVVKRDMLLSGLRREDAVDRARWRSLSWTPQGQPPF